MTDFSKILEKAKELASLPHPFYAKTKQTAQKERRKKIGDAIKKHEKQTFLLRLQFHKKHEEYIRTVSK